MDNQELIGIAVFVVLFAVIMVAAYWYEKQRSKALKQEADKLGFEFVEDPSDDFMSNFGQFHLFSQGHSKDVINRMQGQRNGNYIRIFGYSYTVGYGKHKTTANQTVIAFRSDNIELPNFVLRPESFLHKIGKVFGMEDINFYDYPEFSKMFLLKGENEQAVRDLFSSEVIQFFQQHQGISVEADGNTLIVYRQAKRTKPSLIRNQLMDAEAVLTKLIA